MAADLVDVGLHAAPTGLEEVAGRGKADRFQIQPPKLLFDGRDLVLLRVPFLEPSRRGEVPADREPHVLARVDSEEAVQHRLDLALLLDLDHHRGGQLTGLRDEGVVDVDLVLHPVPGHDPLRPHHLLDLEEDGLAVLEEEGQPVPHRHAAPALRRDDAPTRRLSRLLVLVEALHVGQPDLLHGRPH